ncbi:MAG: phosphate ABC transporter permease subunit PstC [Fibromonadaceae bacterium]|jgi:phosphate transport system permease protein|nr:phosphate ABC transporter permease subunit PstC [Fibromonadaceae bacterium]
MRRFIEKTIENILRLSGLATTIIILLMVVFLFKEGFGLFKNPVVERGHVLCVNASNKIEYLNSKEIKLIFDGKIENWNKLGGEDVAIELFRFNEIFSRYSEEEFGEDYKKLPEKLGEVISSSPGMIAFIPKQYMPSTQQVKALAEEKIGGADFFGGTEWIPTSVPSPQFGVLPLVLGTLLVSLVAILIALPLGLGVAIYISELASYGTRKILKPAVELLAGIPSVVYGFFGLVVLVPLVQKALNLPVGETAFTGSLVLAIMALPTIITVAEDAMRSTPSAMREASLALGATHWQTIYKVIIPYASSGISAAVILGIGRAVGETMAVLMVTGNAAVIPTSLFAPIRTIPAAIAAELGEAPVGGAHYQALFMLGCILFMITLVMSIASELISKRQPGKGV